MSVSGLATVVRNQLLGTNEVDPWGLDADVATITLGIASLPWSITVGGREHVPAEAAALIVANRLLLGTTPLLVAAGVGRATGRVVRFTGIADIAPAGPALRRIGGVLARPDEVRGLLRSGELPAVWCLPRITRSHRVGPAPVQLLEAAVAERAPVVPVAVIAPRSPARCGSRSGRSSARGAGVDHWLWRSWPMPCARRSNGWWTRPVRRPGSFPADGHRIGSHPWRSRGRRMAPGSTTRWWDGPGANRSS